MSERGTGVGVDARSRSWLRTAVVAIAAIALLLVAVAVLDRVQGPSDSECRAQRLDVMSGERASADDSCG